MLLLVYPHCASAEQCWGEYDPTAETECEYEFLSEEDKQIDQFIRDNFTAWWIKNDRVRED